jgi:hypothetical protein
VDVTVVDDTADPETPDSVFPNNWVSFHEDGTLILYPMFAPNRRRERKPGVIAEIAKKFLIKSTFDLSGYEQKDQYLEGTGSMVLDRDKKIAYACLSPRTDEIVLEEFCERTGFQPALFHAKDGKGLDIYHTNVMMCVADRYVVICLDSLPIPAERKKIESIILESGKEIISINMDQMNHFAGNMLQVQNRNGEKLLVMSSRAFESLDENQRKKLTSYNGIIHSSLTAIETNGGGSARCMMAEVHLPLR